MKINLRYAEEQDIPAILGIINYEIINSTVVYDYVERILKIQLEWLKKKEEEGMPVVVAEKNNEILGYGTFGIYRPWDAYKFSVEHSIYIAEKSRGLGIGKLIMTELIKLAKTKGYHTMVAGIDATNKGSFEFHIKFGFTEIGTIKEVGFKFNKWLDLTFMQLFLNK